MALGNLSIYPAQYDDWGPDKVDGTDTIVANHVNKLQDAVYKVQNVIGLNPNFGTTDLVTFLQQSHDTYGNIAYLFTNVGPSLTEKMAVAINPNYESSIWGVATSNSPLPMGVTSTAVASGGYGKVISFGKTYVFANTLNGSAIGPGDRLQLAGYFGHVEKADYNTDYPIGYSLSSLAEGVTSDLIQMFVLPNVNHLIRHRHTGPNDGELLGDDIVDNRILNNSDTFDMASLRVHGPMTVDGNMVVSGEMTVYKETVITTETVYASSFVAQNFEAQGDVYLGNSASDTIEIQGNLIVNSEPSSATDSEAHLLIGKKGSQYIKVDYYPFAIHPYMGTTCRAKGILEIEPSLYLYNCLSVAGTIYSSGQIYSEDKLVATNLYAKNLYVSDNLTPGVTGSYSGVINLGLYNSAPVTITYSPYISGCNGMGITTFESDIISEGCIVAQKGFSGGSSGGVTINGCLSADCLTITGSGRIFGTLPDTDIYIYANDIKKSLNQAIVDDDIGAGGEWIREKSNVNYISSSTFSVASTDDKSGLYYPNRYLKIFHNNGSTISTAQIAGPSGSAFDGTHTYVTISQITSSDVLIAPIQKVQYYTVADYLLGIEYDNVGLAVGDKTLRDHIMDQQIHNTQVTVPRLIREAPIGTIDGYNKEFGVTVYMKPNSTGLFYNGRKMTINSAPSAYDEDYYESGIASITMNFAPSAGDVLRIEYESSDTISPRVYNENLSSQVTGATSLFTLVNRFKTDTVSVYKNGLYLSKGLDYIEYPPNQIQLSITPIIGTTLTTDYDIQGLFVQQYFLSKEGYEQLAYNNNFSSWSGGLPVTWQVVSSGVTISQETNLFNLVSQPYSMKWTKLPGTTDTRMKQQFLSSTDVPEYRGRLLIAEIKVKTTSTKVYSSILEDGTGIQTNSNYSQGSSMFETLRVRHLISNSATGLNIQLHMPGTEAAGKVAYFDELLIYLGEFIKNSVNTYNTYAP